jgi:predicted permease
VESLVLSAIGGVVGVTAAWLLLDLLVANLPMSLPSNAPATVSVRVLAGSAALVLLVTLLFGLAPALRLSQAPLTAALASSPRHGTPLSRRGGQTLIAAEIALAVVLVVGAGLMMRSFGRMLAVDLGFEPAAVRTLEVAPLASTAAEHERFYMDLLQSLRQLPGVAAAGAIDSFPMASRGSISVSATADGDDHDVGLRQVLPGYFEALGLRLVEGRFPTEADRAASPPFLLLSQAAARRMFEEGQATGRPVTAWNKTYTVLGVVSDVRHNGPRGPFAREMFLPYEVPDDPALRALGLTLVVRTDPDAPEIDRWLRATVESLGPRVLVERIRSGDEWLSDSVLTSRRRTLLLTLLGSLGLVLAVVGVFGMTAYAVSRRTQEIGVRMAFGARPIQVVGRMLRDSAIPIGLGAVVGLTGAALSTRVIESFLFETDPVDPLTFTAVAAVLVTAGCLAAWIPARRAACVDPVTALRAE